MILLEQSMMRIQSAVVIFSIICIYAVADYNREGTNEKNDERSSERPQKDEQQQVRTFRSYSFEKREIFADGLIGKWTAITHEDSQLARPGPHWGAG